jgi:hypothetical protein
VGFETTASHNGEMHVSYNDLVSQLLFFKDESNKKCNVFLMKGELCKSKIRLVMHPLQNPLLCSSTFQVKKIYAVNKEELWIAVWFT